MDGVPRSPFKIRSSAPRSFFTAERTIMVSQLTSPRGIVVVFFVLVMDRPVSRRCVNLVLFVPTFGNRYISGQLVCHSLTRGGGHRSVKSYSWQVHTTIGKINSVAQNTRYHACCTIRFDNGALD